MKIKKNKNKLEELRISRFYFVEKIFSRVFIIMLVNTILFYLPMYYANENYGDKSQLFLITSKICLISAIFTIIIGVINAIRPRKCPICNSKMEKIEKDSMLFIKCVNCLLEVNTHMTYRD